MSIWFDNPARFATALGLVSAGLAFALQKVVTSLAGYLVIVRGNTFSIGERITMGGVRGDVLALLRKRYYIEIEELTPKVFYRLTGNWLELTVRFIVREHRIRDAKEVMSRAILAGFQQAGIEIASATYDVVGLPALRLAPDTLNALRSGNGHEGAPFPGTRRPSGQNSPRGVRDEDPA